MTQATRILRPLAAIVALPLLAACMQATPSAMDAVPASGGPEVQQLAQVRDNLTELDAGNAQARATLAETQMPMTAMPDASAMMNSQPAGLPTTAAATQTYLAPLPPMITGLGFAQIANQPGSTLNQKRLLALRAARVEAMRDLTEQVHGLQLTSSTSIGQMVVQSDQLNAVVQGTIRGAKTLSIEPKGSDGYEVKLGLDADTVAYIVRAFRGQI